MNEEVKNRINHMLPPELEEAKKLIEENGGDVTSAVSNITTAVIVGSSPGSKYDKAVKLGIPIWTEEEFIRNIGGNR